MIVGQYEEDVSFTAIHRIVDAQFSLMDHPGLIQVGTASRLAALLINTMMPVTQVVGAVEDMLEEILICTFR